MEEFSLHFCVCVYFSVYDHVYDWSRQLERVLRLLIIFYCKTKCHVLPIEGQAQVQWLIWNPVLSQMTKRANLILGFTLQRWGNEGKGKEVTRPASSSHCGETFMVLMTHEHELHPHGFEHILFSWWLFFLYFPLQMLSGTSMEVHQFQICIHLFFVFSFCDYLSTV